MLVAQPLEDSLGGVLLLGRTRPVFLQDRVDDRDQSPELGLLRRLRPHITRRRRVAAHLRHRVPAQPEHPSRLSAAVTFQENKPPDRRVRLHDKHPQAFPRSDQGRPPITGRVLRRPPPHHAAAPVADFVSAAHTT